MKALKMTERPVGPGPTASRQLKGDPAIHENLFQQQRARSGMDERLDDVIAILDELIRERGVFQFKLHFSSSRAMLWLTDDPFRNRMHVLEEIADPAICLAYPVRPYPEQAVVAPELVHPILEKFRRFRNEDENIYLRTGSLNIIDDLVGLTFSCDCSHYVPVDEFLKKSGDFWLGAPYR